MRCTPSLLVFAALIQGSAGKTALLLIDVQDCFLEANTTSGSPGSLAVPASHIISKINQIRAQKSCLFDEVIFSQDFHPANHISFASTHGLAPFAHLNGLGELPLSCIKPTSGSSISDAACCPGYYVNRSAYNCSEVLCPPSGFDYAVNNSGIIQGNTACTTCVQTPAACFTTTQAMWTDHCLQTGDSTFPPSLDKRAGDTVVQKGSNQYVDAYSAFMDNTASLKTKLDSTLQSSKIDTLYIAGIATDVCVHWTVKDALRSSTGAYTVTVITDATAAVQGNQANYQAALDGMRTAGATLMTTDQVLGLDCPATSTTKLASTVSGTSDIRLRVTVVLSILGLWMTR